MEPTLYLRAHSQVPQTDACLQPLRLVSAEQTSPQDGFPPGFPETLQVLVSSPVSLSISPGVQCGFTGGSGATVREAHSAPCLEGCCLEKHTGLFNCWSVEMVRVSEERGMEAHMFGEVSERPRFSPQHITQWRWTAGRYLANIQAVMM